MNVTITLPQKPFATYSSEERQQKIQLFLALGMYQMEEISIGSACELAGLDRMSFLAILKERNIPIKTQTPDEFEQDINEFMATL
ncbi:MAG TPA: UPF0175 family protein [Anaerolineae bacterium]|nr:UPF0175 family protein [Anaerolineae bacterium]